jgi:telomerase reverse transcriptase
LELQLKHLLDSAVVCTPAAKGGGGSPVKQVVRDDARWEQWLSFSQKGDESYVSLSNGVADAFFSQSEVTFPLDIFTIDIPTADTRLPDC